MPPLGVSPRRSASRSVRPRIGLQAVSNVRAALENDAGLPKTCGFLHGEVEQRLFTVVDGRPEKPLPASRCAAATVRSKELPAKPGWRGDLCCDRLRHSWWEIVRRKNHRRFHVPAANFPRCAVVASTNSSRRFDACRCRGRRVNMVVVVSARFEKHDAARDGQPGQQGKRELQPIVRVKLKFGQ